MKTLKYTSIALLLLLNLQIQAQNKRPANERMESMKIGFLTNKLNLTPEEAKEFWPVYNKYSDELETLRKGRRENIINAKLNIDEMKDSEIEKYHPQFKRILPIKKVGQLYRAEDEFKRKLLDMLKERRDDKMNRPEPQDH
jgi:hypothetical protein